MIKNKNINIPIGYLNQTTFIYYKSLHKYDKAVSLELDKIRNFLNINILCPTHWEAFGNKQKNLRWNKNEIFSLIKAIMKVPNPYKEKKNSPQKILLLKCSNFFSDKMGGGYDSGTIAIYIPQDLFGDKNKPLYEKNFQKLRSTLIHEWSHCFLEKNISLFNEWVLLTKWTQNNMGKWKNKDEKRILLTHANANKYPTEDFAVSVSFINTGIKSDFPKNIVDYFIKHELIYDEPKNKLSI